MLGFFRKHQKFFFVVVTFFIVVSFSFFGTFNTFLDRGEKGSDKEVGHLIDGTVLKEQKLQGLVRLLQYGMDEGGGQVNLLNDSMIHKDMIMSGLGEMLAEHHYEKFAEELATRWKRAKLFSPYVHPYAPTINARAVWAQFCPKMLVLLEELKQAPEELSKEQLPLLFKLYQTQGEFSAPYLHQVLYYQQANNDQIRQDMSLPNANLALFGFQTIEDWFGTRFQEEVAQFILNGACIAREEGYLVKKEEAKVDLFSNVYRGLKVYSRGENPSGEEAQQYYLRQIRNLGFDEPEAIALWKEVMHFKRFFHEVGESVFLDQLSFNQFKDFAKPSHEICRYHLPRSLQFHNFREMLKFQRYLEIVADEGSPILELPTHLRHAENIMDAYPELVYKAFDVEIASTTKLDASGRISLKQTWQWEAESANFAKLQNAFPKLAKHAPRDAEERIQTLDGLDELTRFKVDQFARSAYVEEHPEIINELLAQARKESQTLKVSLKEIEDLFSGQHFLGLLEIEDKTLNRYSVDGETFYSIQVLDKGKGWHVFSFEEANKATVLDYLLDELLMAAYSGMELEESFDEIKDELGAKVYTDLLKAIAKGIDISTREDYPKHRFDQYLKKMRNLAVEDSERFAQAQKGPWALDEKKDQIALGAKALFIGEYSKIEGASFYRLIDKKEIGTSDTEVAAAKVYLKKDAEQELMRKLLQKF